MLDALAPGGVVSPPSTTPTPAPTTKANATFAAVVCVSRRRCDVLRRCDIILAMLKTQTPYRSPKPDNQPQAA